MVNPQISKKNADDAKKGIPKQLLCAPFALALTAAIPMGAAYADEVAPSVEQDSSSAAVEVVDDSSEASSEASESSEGSSTESESGSADVSASESAAPEAGNTASTSAPAASSAPKPSSSSDDSEEPTPADLLDKADADADAETDADADADVAANAGAEADADAAADNAEVADPAEAVTEEQPDEEMLIVAAAAAGQTETTVTGEYKQSEARKMLDLVNADREKTNGSQALTWDYALEQYAMQRAAEIAYSFSHTRPNEEPFSTEIMKYGYYSVGENIHKATGTNSHGATKANQAWIDSTGHHINRTKEKWQGYAAACFFIANTAYGPMWCWVELFSTPNGNPNYVAPTDAKKTMTVVLKGENHQTIEGITTDDGKSPYSLGWWYDEKKDKFTYIREVTYTSYVPMYIGLTGNIGGKYYTFDTEGFLTKESEKDLPFTREQFLGLTNETLVPDQGVNGGANGGSNSANPDKVSVINTKYSRSEESLTRTTPGAIQDEYGYTLYVTPEILSAGAHWETQGNRRVFRLADGNVATGWLVHEGQRYYLDPNGEMATGWRRINGAWYFFDAVNGTMKTGLFEHNGDRYYMNDKGAMQTGPVVIDGKNYVADLSGIIREA